MALRRLATLCSPRGSSHATSIGLSMVRWLGTQSDGEDSPHAASRLDNAAAQHAIVLPMPKLSHTMTSGRIAKWNITEGSHISTYDVMLTVETETLVEEAYRVDQFAGKVALLVESQEEVHVARLLAAEGEDVPVGRPIALLCEHAEDIPAINDASAGIANVRDAYDGGLRLLEWQSYLARGPPSSGCL